MYIETMRMTIARVMLAASRMSSSMAGIGMIISARMRITETASKTSLFAPIIRIGALFNNPVRGVDRCFHRRQLTP